MSNIKLLLPMVLISRDAMTKPCRPVKPWELDIYRNIHGEAAVVVGAQIFDVTVPDSAELEFKRLEKVFGTPPEGKDSHAVEVFGRGAAGIAALKASILAGIRNGLGKTKADERMPFAIEDAPITDGDIVAAMGGDSLLDEALNDEQPVAPVVAVKAERKAKGKGTTDAPASTDMIEGGPSESDPFANPQDAAAKKAA